MNLTIRDGQLTLGSVFKLVAISWLCFGVVVFGGLFLLLLLIGVASGSMVVNGDMVQGRGSVLVAMLPLLILLPIIFALQAVIFGAFATAGAALYRLRKPLSVTVERTTPSQL
ncbi:MAG: hypothetical protein ACI8U3_000734 [Brevundimonas sp.]|jgi:hypothetical protein|uniref:hypothetical protein n=1 Tax=Brevundimonas sp. TaxID=1871086 RepID=UPI0039E40AAB